MHRTLEITQSERASIVAAASDLNDCNIDRFAPTLSGRYIADDQRDEIVAVAIDIIDGHGLADEIAGDVEQGYYMARVGRLVTFTDAQGFSHLGVYGDADEAMMAVERQAAEQYPRESESETERSMRDQRETAAAFDRIGIDWGSL